MKGQTHWEYHVLRSSWLESDSGGMGGGDAVPVRVSCGRYLSLDAANMAAEREMLRLHTRGSDTSYEKRPGGAARAGCFAGFAADEGIFDEINVSRDRETGMLTLHGEAEDDDDVRNTMVFVERMMVLDAVDAEATWTGDGDVASEAWNQTRKSGSTAPATAYTVWETITHYPCPGSASPMAPEDNEGDGDGCATECSSNSGHRHATQRHARTAARSQARDNAAASGKQYSEENGRA